MKESMSKTRKKVLGDLCGPMAESMWGAGRTGNNMALESTSISEVPNVRGFGRTVKELSGQARVHSRNELNF